MIGQVDKTRLMAHLCSEVQEELAQLIRAQKATQAGATHEESRPENDKDTRALESTYLARGLAERVVALEANFAALKVLKPRVFGEDDPAALGGLVHVEFEDGDALYLIAPAGGGLKLQFDALTIQVLTLQAPMGRALLGKYVDEDVEFTTPQGRREGSIVEIR